MNIENICCREIDKKIIKIRIIVTDGDCGISSDEEAVFGYGDDVLGIAAGVGYEERLTAKKLTCDVSTDDDTWMSFPWVEYIDIIDSSYCSVG